MNSSHDRLSPGRLAYYVGKPLLMPALSVRLVAGSTGPVSRPVLTGQALSWGGDIALMRPGRPAFLTGMGLFLGAHLSYVAAYRQRSSSPVLGSPGRRGFLAAGAAAAGAMAFAAGRRDRALALPVAVYGTTLATMVASAAAVDPDRGRGRLLAGAGLFMLSDALIGVREFLAGQDSTALEAAVLGTYAVAQWCITEGIIEARDRRGP